MDRDRAESATPSVTVPVGHLLTHNKKKVVVASTAASTGEVSSTTIIPRAMIVKIVRLSNTKFYKAD